MVPTWTLSLLGGLGSGNSDGEDGTEDSATSSDEEGEEDSPMSHQGYNPADYANLQVCVWWLGQRHSFSTPDSPAPVTFFSFWKPSADVRGRSGVRFCSER